MNNYDYESFDDADFAYVQENGNNEEKMDNDNSYIEQGENHQTTLETLNCNEFLTGGIMDGNLAMASNMVDAKEHEGEEFNMKEGDIFHWQYLTDTSSMDYWCCSRIGIVKSDGWLHDTYWGSQDNRKFAIKDIGVKISVDFIANINDLEPVSRGTFVFYDTKDIVDISHSNSHCDDGCYLRKGAKKSLEKMKKLLRLQIEHDEKEAAYHQRKADDNKAELEKLTIDSWINICDEVKRFNLK